jgi:anti-sigma factor RsiW
MNGTRQSNGTHPDAGTLERYRSRTAAPAELLAVDAHIASCDSCFDLVRAAQETIDLPALEVDSHTSYDELEAFVDGRAGATARELITAHTAVCQLCSEELADLIAVRDGMPRRPRSLNQLRLRRPQR